MRLLSNEDVSDLDAAPKRTAVDGSGPHVRFRDLYPRPLPAYAVVFHPVYRDPAAPAGTWRDAAARDDPAARGAIVPGVGLLRTIRTDAAAARGLPTVTWASLLGAVDVRTDWRQLARAFDYDSWPRGLHGPAEGLVDPPTLRRHLDHLRPVTRSRVAWYQWAFHAAEYEHNRAVAERWSGLAVGTIDDVLEFQRIFGVAPWLVWDLDHGWFLCTHEDSSRTIVGGPRVLIDGILDDPALETLEAGADDRVWHAAPG